MAEGRPVVAEHLDETVDRFFAAWMRADEHRVAPGDQVLPRETYRLRIGKDIGRRRLTDLTPEVCAALVSQLPETANSTRTTATAVEVASAMLGAAVRWGCIPANQCAQINASRIRAGGAGVRGEKRILSADKVRTHFGVANFLRNDTMIRVAAAAGLQHGEVIGLRWTDVDLEGRRIHIRRSV
jgi:integrase